MLLFYITRTLSSPIFLYSLSRTALVREMLLKQVVIVVYFYILPGQAQCSYLPCGRTIASRTARVFMGPPRTS